MFGCILLGGFAMMGFAAMARRRRHAWWHFHHHHGPGVPGWSGGWAGGGGGPGLSFSGREAWGGRGPCGRSSWGPGAHGSFFSGAPGHDPYAPFPFFASPRFGRGHWLRHLLRRVETTPTQERAIEAALTELAEVAKPLRAEAKRSRADLAAALRRSSLDEVVLGEMFARHDRIAEELRRGLVGLLAKVHDILDDIQRERFASLLEKGGWWRGVMSFHDDESGGDDEHRDRAPGPFPL